MEDHALDFEPRLKGVSLKQWFVKLREIADEFGAVHPLGSYHAAYLLLAGPKLLVTFENVETIQNSKLASEPRGYVYAREEGWTCLTIISYKKSWFRDPEIYSYFDDLTDSGFFDEFEEVLFYGAGEGGYAAAAYSVACPGAKVLAIRPQATLNPRLTGFDRRYLEYRSEDFTSRYGYAPDMIDAAAKAYVVFDPYQKLDACHAALFAKRNVSLLRCPNLGNDLETTFDILGIHDELMLAAMEDRLSRRFFAKLLRARRVHSPYLRRLFNRAITNGHQKLAAHVTSFVTRKSGDPILQQAIGSNEDQPVKDDNGIPPQAAAT